MIWLEETASTNSFLKEHIGDIAPFEIVAARNQTAGRGQRGNSWETEPGKNLTFSFHFSPENILPREQFVISEAIALAMTGVLNRYGIEARVKWPNDIYVEDRKICGILIENSIMGTRIADSIIGAGLNVNQEIFLSDAPNPVSMRQLTGVDYDLDEVGEIVEENIRKYFEYLKLPGDRGELERLYHASLWRNDGSAYPFVDTASVEGFEARIRRVEPTGHLMLDVQRDGETAERRVYAFKEVGFVL